MDGWSIWDMIEPKQMRKQNRWLEFISVSMHLKISMTLMGVGGAHYFHEHTWRRQKE